MDINNTIYTINKFMVAQGQMGLEIVFGDRNLLISGYDPTFSKKLIMLIFEQVPTGDTCLLSELEYRFKYNGTGDLLSVIRGKELQKYREEGFGYIGYPVYKISTTNFVSEDLYIPATNLDYIIYQDS